MDLTIKERDLRWKGAREIMAKHELDVIIASSDLGDVPGYQRYLSGYRSTFSSTTVLVFAEGEGGLVLEHPGTIAFAKDLSWIPSPIPMMPASGELAKNGPTVGGGLSHILKERGASRIGIAGFDRFPKAWYDTIEASIPNTSFVDVRQELLMQRLVKSPEEQEFIKEACRISDLAWEAIPDIVHVGRKRYEVAADIEHILRLNGCEDSYNMLEELPLLEGKKDRFLFSGIPIKKGGVYIIEVSPRYLGYYGQQTTIVSVGGKIPTEMRQVHDSVNRAREEGLKIMKAGVDILEVTAAVNKQLRKDGYEPAAPTIGHFVGLDLEDLRAGDQSLILEEGMTFIFHPFAAGHPAVMRADTYLITNSGAERLTRGDIGVLEL